MYNTDHIGIAEIPGNSFEADDLMESNRIARTGMWISHKLVYSRNRKLELPNKGVASIKVGFPHRQRINVIAYYRQWNMLSLLRLKHFSIRKQANKMNLISTLWAKALKSNEEKL